MKITQYTRYSMTIKRDRSYSIVAPNGKSHFIKPETQTGQKLYLVGLGKQLHYVGITNRQMSARISMGLKAKGKNGYHGYAWKNIREQLTLHVICWSGSGNLRKGLEAIEAEVAYLCRKETGKWPLSQTEIHFRPSDTSHKQLALKVWNGFRWGGEVPRSLMPAC